MSDETVTDRIKNRDSWLRFLAVAATVGVVLWRVATAEFDLSGVVFSDFLSLLLALFAMALSVAFYFKAAETSNTFYDNTYRFTKEVSEILGRIEAGFGERLKHLDEGYSGLRDTFSRMPFDTQSASKALGEKEEGAAKLEAEREQLLRELADRARLRVEERTKFFEQLDAKESELRHAKKEVHQLERRLAQAQPSGLGHDSRERSSLLRRVTDYVQAPPRRALLADVGGDFSMDALRQRFEKVESALPKQFVRDLESLDFYRRGAGLTDRGARWLRASIIQAPPASAVEDEVG